MMKSVVNGFLRHFGLQIIRSSQAVGEAARTLPATQPDSLSGFVDRISQAPLNAALHLEHADAAEKAGRTYLAYAELKTAEFLGADPSITAHRKVEIFDTLPPQEDMGHNLYFRFQTLLSEIQRMGDPRNFSILDVGGGQGELASFIPDSRYCLVEPRVNGISGTNLPFADDSFDYAISCHVLEHIPVSQRPLFLDQLMAKSRRGVILLNPFFVEGTYFEERMQLVVEIMNAWWAKEHLEYQLPSVSDLQEYADQRGLQISIRPSGTLTTSLAFVFLDDFASRSESLEDWKKVNRFFNCRYGKILDSPEFPVGYVVFLSRDSRVGI